jgi:type VI secretion system Hcp family effector
MNPRKSSLLGFFVLGGLILGAASSACGAVKFYVRLEGQKQGPFKGEGRGSHAGWIPCEEFAYQAEPATGQASGKRQLKSLTFTELVDASSPQFSKALKTGEIFPSADFEFVHESDKVYKKIHLTDVLVTSVRRVPSRGERVSGEIEEISLTFRTVAYSVGNGKGVATDDWLSTQ